MRASSRAFALVLFAVTLGMTGFGLASLVMPGSERMPDRPSFVDVLIFSSIFMTFPAVGLVVAWQRREHPVGWLFLVVGFGISEAIFASEYAGRVAFAGADLFGAPLVAWLGGWAWAVATGVALPLAVILFPDGRLPGARWRGPVGLGLGAMALGIAASAVNPRPLEGYGGRFPNPFAVTGPIGDVAAVLAGPGVVVILVMQVVAMTALAVRFRRSRGTERQQLKWLLYPMSLLVVGLAIAIPTTISAAWSAALIGLGGVAVGVGIAILRHRLFDIDLVIRRTLVYGAVVAVLGAVYVALVIGLQAALSGITGGGSLPVALSTLVTAALFGPVRARVRELVDRRFYRARYSAQRTLETFGAQLRDEVELEAVARRLIEVAEVTVRPARSSVWLRDRRAG